LLKEQAPIIVGGFAKLGNATEPRSTQAVVNWDLAFDEFNTRLSPGLLPYPAGGQSRPFVGVVCQGYDNQPGGVKDISKSVSHLVSEIGVTSVLASMPATELYNAWNASVNLASNVLFMNTGSADLKLVNTPNNGLIWHILGDPHMLAGTIVALFHQMEPWIYHQRKTNFQATNQDDPDTVPLRVTIVYSDYSSMLDIHDVLVANDTVHPESHLAFNGKSWLDNTVTGDAREWRVVSGAAAGAESITNAITDIQQHPPHVVLGIATQEFATVMASVEAGWKTSAPSQIRPYYLLSHLLYNNTSTMPNAVTAQENAGTPPLHLRMAGVNYAEAQDKHSQDLYLAYENRLVAANPNAGLAGLSLPGTENHYDGAYYLLYAISAAAAYRSGTPGALAIRDGLQSQVINTSASATVVDVDPGKISNTVNSLFTNSAFSMTLWGTMGYPNFDTRMGTRYSQTSAWCYQKNTSGTWGYQADGLVYDPQTQSFAPNKNGMPACLQSYCPQDADAGVGHCLDNY
jgi:hypothetical protein